MSLFISSLNSGSNGNCYYIGNDNEAVLIDAGLSCRETEKRMARSGLHMDRVKAIFISHEHTDHIFGLPAIARKYQLPVYITDRTRVNAGMSIDPKLVYPFHAFHPVEIGNLSIYAFPKHHDAADPHSFIVSSSSVRIGVFTDIGNACNNVVDSFRQCNAVFLESNYDEKMLTNGKYPYHLKQRIRGGKGHLSNTQAYQLFTQHRPSFLSHLVLSHLSHENNSPEIAEALFQPEAFDTKLVVASRFRETDVYRIEARGHRLTTLPVKSVTQQLTLF